MKRMEANAANAGAPWNTKQYSKWNTSYQFISMQSIPYTTEQKAICREESMRSNMLRNTMQQYCINNSFTFPLLLRFARRTDKLGSSRDVNMQLRTFSINIHSPIMESKHKGGITTTLVYSTSSHPIQRYQNTAISFKQLWTLHHFIQAQHFIPPKQDI